MESKRVLIVTYFFPPVGGIGVQRALSMARYLPRYGLEVHVLTAANPAAPVRDAALVSKIPAEVRVHRAFTLEPPFYLRKRIWEVVSRRRKVGAPAKSGEQIDAGGRGLLGRLRALFCPDPQVFWTPLACRKACEVIVRHDIDTVLVTAPPFSAFLIGNTLKRRFPHLKLVSDFRDEWLRFYLADFEFLRDERTLQLAVRIERETVDLSDLVVAVTETSRREIRQRYPEQPESKFATVHNGYDPELLIGVAPRRHASPGRMIVTHMGTAYTTASPRGYLEILDAFPEDLRDRIETRFIGRVAESETETFVNRKSPVKLYGFMPQEQAWQLAAETDYLLLIMTNDFSLPGKVFEYLSLGKPILALSPSRGEVARLIEETKAGWCVDASDPKAVRAMLIRAWERLRREGQEFHPDIVAINRYQRPHLVGKLAALLRDGEGT